MANPGLYPCAHCGKDFFAPTRRFKFCSAECRFFSNVRIDTKTGCHLWLGKPNDKGYGQFNFGNLPDGKDDVWLAHRAAWRLFEFYPSEEEQIDHRVCRTKLCVNTDHMAICTLVENIMQPDGAAAINAAKTHCPMGHEYSGENLIEKTQKGGQCKQRICATCYKMCYMAYSARRSAERQRRRLSAA